MRPLMVVPTILLGTLAIPLSRCQAGVTNWTIQSASSNLALSATFYLGVGDFHLEGQGPTSLTTQFEGTVQTQQNFLAPGVPSEIQFLSAALDAQVSGDWEPLPGGATGTAPADYAARGYVDTVVISYSYIALRDLTFDLASGVLPLSDSPLGTQNFTGDLDVTTLTGITDYDSRGGLQSLLGDGSATMVGLGGGSASAGSVAYDDLNGMATLTIPLDFQFFTLFESVVVNGNGPVYADIGVMTRFQGSIVATAPIESVPEASSLVLLGLAGSVGGGFVGYRRRFRTASR